MAGNGTRIYQALIARLKDEKRHEAFKLQRDHIKKMIGPQFRDEVIIRNLGWRVAAFHFPPLDGRVVEVPLTDQIEAILEVIPPPNGIIRAAPVEVVEEVYDDEPYLDGTVGAREITGPDAHKKLGLPEPKKSADGKLTYHENGSHPDNLKAAFKFKDTWDELARSVDRTKRCKPFDMIQWVFENAGVPVDLIDPADVPSSGALNYLRRIKNDDGVYDSFMEKLYSKTIPDKRQLEHEGKQRDDGRPQLRLLDAFDEEFAGLEQEGAA
jgi:hypothetical protein